MTIRDKLLILFCLTMEASGLCGATHSFCCRTAKINLQPGAVFRVVGEICDFGGTLKKDANAAIYGNEICFNNGSLEEEDKTVVLSGNFNPETNSFELDGSKKLFIESGAVLNNIYVSGENNQLVGALQLTQDIELQDMNTGVTCNLWGRMPRNIVLNGGTVFLDEDLHFIDDKFFLGSGTILLNNRNLHLGSTEMTSDSELYFDQAQDIELHATFHLSSKWTFSRDGVLEGNGSVLCLEEGGELVVERGSSLKLKNIVVQGVKENNLSCLDEDGTIFFENVNLVQDGNYSFTLGKIEIAEDLKITGTHTFSYQSAQESVVHSHSRLLVDRGATFKFDPIWNDSFSDEEWALARNFLTFEDETSQLVLRGATLYVAITAMKLKKGTLGIKNKSYVYAEVDSEWPLEEGLVIGDNNASDDMICKVYPGAGLMVLNGSLSYKNMNSSSWEMMNERSKLEIGCGGKLKLHQSLNVGEGHVSFCGGSRLAKATGKSLSGGVLILGSICNERCYN